MALTFDEITSFFRADIDPNELERLIVAGEIDPNQKLEIGLFDVDGKNINIEYPLLHIIAGKKNSVDLAKMLIKYGADSGSKDSLPARQWGSEVNNTPLLAAIACDDEALAHYLIDLYI